jgi:hypothetical protein
MIWATYIFDSAEVTTQRHENQSHKEYMFKVMQSLNEMPLQMNPFASHIK